MNDKTMLFVAGALIVGFWFGKRAQPPVIGGGADRIVDDSQDWWTYAGGWAA